MDAVPESRTAATAFASSGVKDMPTFPKTNAATDWPSRRHLCRTFLPTRGTAPKPERPHETTGANCDKMTKKAKKTVLFFGLKKICLSLHHQKRRFSSSAGRAQHFLMLSPGVEPRGITKKTWTEMDSKCTTPTISRYCRSFSLYNVCDLRHEKVTKRHTFVTNS